MVLLQSIVIDGLGMKLFSDTLTIWEKTRLAVSILLFSLCFTTTVSALEINAPAPGFTLPDLNGKQVSLADFRGKVVILKLGTTWCPGCRDLSRELQALDEFLKEQRIVLIDVFLDDPASAVQAYQKEHPMKTAVVTLLGGQPLIRSYGVYAIPRLLILSPEQLVVSDSTGMTARQIKARILQIQRPGTSKAQTHGFRS